MPLTENGFIPVLQNGALDNLKKKVYSKTGVPPQLQKLFYKNRLIKDLDSLKSVPNEANIVQVIAIVGDGNDCNVCFDKSVLLL